MFFRYMNNQFLYYMSSIFIQRSQGTPSLKNIKSNLNLNSSSLEANSIIFNIVSFPKLSVQFLFIVFLNSLRIFYL